MRIKFENKELYYKYSSILELLIRNNISIVESKRTDDYIEIEFKNKKDYKKAFNGICIIPIDHEIIDGDNKSNSFTNNIEIPSENKEMEKVIFKNSKIKNDIIIYFVESYTDKQKRIILTSHKLINYIKRNTDHENVKIKSIRIDKVNFFGNNIGFIYLESDIEVDGKKVPGISFIRGDSVSIMIILNTNKGRYTVLVEQYRHSVGDFKKGIPAGMIDEEGKVSSTAIQEIEEEVGNLNITEDELIYLDTIQPSSGGCDENVILYAVEKDYDYDELIKFQDKITGCEEGNEVIKVDIQDYDYLKNTSGKGYISYMKYNDLKKDSKKI